MASQQTAIQVSNATATLFRAWAQLIHDFLAANGWVQTADASQINLAITAAPSAAGQSMGYEIWHMGDALQATAPVFIKLEYGSGPNRAAQPGIWIQAGQGSDGAGQLTGVQTGRLRANGTEWSGALQAYLSGAAGRFAFGAHAPLTQYGSWCFGIERTKDGAGADTAEGVLLLGMESEDQTAGRRQSAAALIFGVSGTQTGLISVGGSAQNTYSLGPVMDGGIATANDGTDVGIHPWSFPSRRGSENPGMNFHSYWRQDFAAASLPLVNVYGADRSYVCLGGDAGQRGVYGTGNVQNNDQMLMMRFE